MKNKIILFLLLCSNFYAQNVFVGFNYSKEITSKNYVFSSVYTLEGDYEILKDYITFGITASIIDAKILNSFIKNPPPVNPNEFSYKFGIQIKYYLLMDKKDSNSLIPYIDVELGDYITDYVST